jgi:hypothetical protein
MQPGCRPPQDLVSCSSSLLRRRSSRSSADSSVLPPPRSPLVGAARPSSRSTIFSQRARQDSEIPKSPGDLRDRRLALAGHRDHVTTELRRERLGHDADPSSEAAASQARSQPNRGQSPLSGKALIQRLLDTTLTLVPSERLVLSLPQAHRSPRSSRRRPQDSPSRAVRRA